MWLRTLFKKTWKTLLFIVRYYVNYLTFEWVYLVHCILNIFVEGTVRSLYNFQLHSILIIRNMYNRNECNSHYYIVTIEKLSEES